MPYLETMHRSLVSKRFALIGRGVLITVVLSVEVYLLYHLRAPILTRSISPVLMWRVADPQHLREIKDGNYVDFDQYAPKPFDKVMRLIKRVGCSSGETLTMDKNDYYYCNGTYLAQAKREVAGKPIIPFQFNGVIPAGKLFVVGDVARSYDSRVYGFVDRARLKGVLWPLL